MATQGLVTVTSDGQVVMKVVAGCNGMLAKSMAQSLAAKWPLSTEEAHSLALRTGFGDATCLVVMTTEDVCSLESDLHPRYHETFQQPDFNPRWEHGTADHTVIIEV